MKPLKVLFPELNSLQITKLRQMLEQAYDNGFADAVERTPKPDKWIPHSEALENYTPNTEDK